jgi:hypothetical protein
MRALNGLLRRLTGHRDSWSNTSLKSQQVRKVVRPKRTAFEALEERYLLSDCVAPRTDSRPRLRHRTQLACDLAQEPDARIRRMVLFHASLKYAALCFLAPVRPHQAVVCLACEGTGILRDVPPDIAKNVICTCGGLGWLMPNET